MKRRVIAYAHQGGSYEAPSSTLYAMRKALEVGATALELDVHSTYDGHLVICHDATVERTTNGTGAISDLKLSELKQLDNAYWFIPDSELKQQDIEFCHQPENDASSRDYIFRGYAPDDPEFQIPTLREVLEAFPGVILNLDIKSTAPTVPGYEGKLARLLAEYKRQDDVIVASFFDSAIETFSGISPQIPVAAPPSVLVKFYQLLKEQFAGEDLASKEQLFAPYVALQVPASYQDIKVVEPGFVKLAHDLSLAVHVWTINDKDEMKQLVDMGVDGVITDRPSLLVDVLNNKHCNYI